MALPIQSSLFLNKPYDLFLSNSPVCLSVTRFALKSKKPSSESSNAAANVGSSSVTDSPMKPTSSGLGFGRSTSPSKKESSVNVVSDKRKKKKNQTSTGDRTSVTRRFAVEKRPFLSAQVENQSIENMKGESKIFLLWLGLGLTILIEGVVLSASGFLPDEMDKFLTKYIYPTFTPTVILFLAIGVSFGISTYLKDEKRKFKK